MPVRKLLLACLVFSGLSALVYQVLWTRLLGFTFGTSTEAIGTVLAVFFGGMALGNWIAARGSSRVERPLRLYAILELGIGVFAVVSLPILQNLHAVYAWIGTDHGPAVSTLARVALSALTLLPPTIAMGATLPVVARGLVDESRQLGRWSAYLYTANTLGAVAGAYLSGFWMIPTLGLTQTVLVAAGVNLAVAGLVWIAAGGHRVPAQPEETATARAEAPSAADAPSAAEAPAPPCARAGGERAWFLAFFGVSGFVAIGYEIVWSKAFTIVMEGTLYGFTTVLSAYLLGIALGSLAISGLVDRIRDPSRAFGLLHVGIGVSVAVGIAAVGDLPYWYLRANPEGQAGIHSLYLVAAPIVILPTALFGAAFPLLMRLYTTRAAEIGRGFGLATAINTAGSIAASLVVSFWWIDRIGIDATLYLLLLLEIGVGVAVLLRFQAAEGRRRLATAGPALVVFALVAGSYNGVGIERAITGRTVRADTLEQYRSRVDERTEQTQILIEGRTSIVTVHESPTGWNLQNNGLPEATFSYAPPYRALETVLLGVLPYVLADSPDTALMIGFGGGSTVDALLRTNLQRIEVVELEEAVIEAIPVLYRGRPNPLADPRLTVRVNDGRNELLKGRYREGSGYDIIASQPSHPWLAGAANLFTREFFELASENLAEDGIFAIWVNGFHTDAESVLAIVASFEEVFPGSALVSGGAVQSHSSLLLLGGHGPITWNSEQARTRMDEDGLAEELALHGIETAEDLLARFEGPGAAFAATWSGPHNTDDNAFVETRLSRIRNWEHLDFADVESGLPRAAPVLPRVEGSIDLLEVAGAMLPRWGWPLNLGWSGKLRRLVAAHGEALGPFERERILAEAAALEEPPDQGMTAPLEALARRRPDRPEPHRAIGRHWAVRAQDFARSAAAYDAAWKISGDVADAARAAIAWRRAGDARARARLADAAAAERSHHPQLALLEAQRALEAKADAPTMERHLRTLLAFRRTREGSFEPRLNALLARLAAAAGHPRMARVFRDADYQERTRRAGVAIGKAQHAVARGQWEEAEQALQKARELLPGDYRVMQLAVEIAVGRDDVERIGRAFQELRWHAPDPISAVKTENRLRASLGMPLLPERPAEVLARSFQREVLEELDPQGRGRTKRLPPPAERGAPPR